jgi:uncharacterized repeat protein (TIGR01451 family)
MLRWVTWLWIAPAIRIASILQPATAFFPRRTLRITYDAASGWDFTTGIGSVNVANLVNGWPTSNSAALSITKTHTGNFTQGQQNTTYTVTVSNGANAGSTNGTVTVAETVPSGLTLVSMTGTGWTCGASSCMRSDALNEGASYPAITVTVNVAANATTPQVNQVIVSGGGSAIAGATDPTTIVSIFRCSCYQLRRFRYEPLLYCWLLPLHGSR